MEEGTAFPTGGEIESLRQYCLAKKGAYLDHPFGPDSDIIKVKNKIFAQLFLLKGIPMITVNGDLMTNEFYRGLYPEEVKCGYHCPPVQQPYFNTVRLESGVPLEEVCRMVDLSYQYVVGKLPKKVQRELEG